MFLECLVVRNFGKSLLNAGLEKYCFEIWSYLPMGCFDTCLKETEDNEDKDGGYL